MDKLSDEEILQKVTEFREDCEMGNADLFARMVKAEDFRNGKQWDPATEAYRRQKNKFCLTIPLVKSQVNQVVGAQINNPKDVVVVPERSGSATGARVRSRIVKHAMDSEQAIFEITHWFDSGVTTGLGFIGAFIDRHEDPRHGNLTIEHMSEFECGLDPNCLVYDINSHAHGAKYFIWEPWIDKDLIHEKYPKKRVDLENEGYPVSPTDPTGFFGWLWNSGKEIVSSISRTLAGRQTASEDTLEKYKYKVTHTWWRRPKQCVVMYVEGEPETEAMTFVKDADIKAAKRLAKARPDRVGIEKVVVNVICHTVRVGQTLLEHAEDELNGVMKYPIGVYSAHFSKGYRCGLTEDMIGTQEEINWTQSQKLEVIRNFSTYHWKIRKDMSGGKFPEQLRAHGDENNIVIDQSLGGGEVEKSQPRMNTSGLERSAEIAKENLKLISNVRTEDPSFDSKNLSGKAIALKQLNSQTGQASMFMNFDYAYNLFGRLLDEIIMANDIYSPDEIRAIVEEDDLVDTGLMLKARDEVESQLEQAGYEIPEPPPPLSVNPSPEEVAANHQQAILYDRLTRALDKLARPIAEDLLLEEIKNIRKGRYTTKVILSSYAPTMRMIEQAEYRELNQELIASGHPPLSRKRLIEASDVDNKEEILQEDEMIQRQMMQAAAQRNMIGAKGAA